MISDTTLYTIGHSNHALELFFGLLHNHGIQILVDIRSFPSSQHNPQYNQQNLREALQQQSITYHWAGRQLGGKRERDAADTRSSVHTRLAEALRPFAEYMQSAEFARATTQLINLAIKAPTAIMCAEADPMSCHRQLLADYLILQGVRVMHIHSNNSLVVHELSPGARRESAELIYDRLTTAQLNL